MRKPLLIALSLLTWMAFVLPVQAGQGGPDTYGYTWKDSNEPDVSFTWIDITALPGAVNVSGLGDDNAVGQFPIGWDFHYYWTDYDMLKIGSNGWLSFDDVGNIAACFPTIPSQGGAGDNLICPFMSDVNFSDATGNNPAEIWYWSNGVDSFIVQYRDAGWWTNAAVEFVGENDFQVVFDGTDSSITFNYLDTDAANFPGGAGCPTFMEVGIENLTGNFGLAVFSGTTLPPDNFSIKFIYPPTVTFQVPDATPAWNANAENGGQFFFVNTNVDLESNISNVGSASVTASVNVTATVDSTSNVGSTIYTNSVILDSVPFGDDTTITFTAPVILPEARSYFFNVDLASSGDINPSNNSNSSEIVAVMADPADSSYILDYHEPLNLQSYTFLNWAGGGNDEGAAVEYFPPSYPFVLDSVRIFLANDGNNQTPYLHGCTIEILDGPNGNVLASDSFPPSALNDGSFSSLPISGNIVINSGGFVVSWLQGGSDIALAREADGPISQRSYEILGATWAPFRDNTAEDFIIEVVGSSPPIMVGVDQPAASIEMTAYPNPVTGQLLNVEYSVTALSDVRFEVTSLTGQRVWSKTHSQIPTGNYRFNIQTAQLTSGVYFLSMEQNGEKMVQKVVVE